MRKHALFAVAAVVLSSQISFLAMAQDDLPKDPWANYNMPTVNTGEHNPFHDHASRHESLPGEHSALEYEYFHDVPGRPAKYADTGEINVEYVSHIVNYLRDIGYEIDPKVDLFVASAPARARGLMLSALYDLRSAPSNSIEGNLGMVLSDLEELTGFNMENIISNTTRLLGAEQ